MTEIEAIEFTGNNGQEFIALSNEFNMAVWTISAVNGDYVGPVLTIRSFVIYPSNWVIFTNNEIVICEAKGGIYDWNKRTEQK